MTDECRPPENTPDGTWCELVRDDERLIAEWTGASWNHGWLRRASPDLIYGLGWRFHSIAAPPAVVYRKNRFVIGYGYRAHSSSKCGPSRIFQSPPQVIATCSSTAARFTAAPSAV
jgi:hypothetical protein